VAVIAQMIQQVQQRHHLDSSRTYAAGLSAGAALATIVALRHPNLIAAVGLHSAPVFATSDSAMSAYRTMQQGSPHAHSAVVREFLAEHAGFPGMPVMVIHGDEDTVVRRINAEELAQQFLSVNEAQLSSTEATRRLHGGRSAGQKPRLAYHTDTWYAKRKPYVVNCTINGLGHAWSGGDRSAQYTEPSGPNASLMMWEFFEHHQRLPDSTAGA
jgi:poly(3-hydroxybutyrate) depolymerase